MLSKHYTTVLTLAILLTWGIAPKSLASSEKVKSNSFLEDKVTKLSENTFNDRNVIYDSEKTILAQDTSLVDSDSNTSANTNNPAQLWWLAPLVILVPFLGFLSYRSGSQTKKVDKRQITENNNAHGVGFPSSTPSNVKSELAVDSSTSDRLVREDIAVATVDNRNVATISEPEIVTETVPESEIVDSLETVDNRNVDTISEPEIVTETVPESEIVDSLETVDNITIDTISESEIVDELVIVDNPTIDTVSKSEVLDAVEKPIYNEQTPTESYVEKQDNQQLWEQSQSAEASFVTEEIISESPTNSSVELQSTFVDNENLDDSNIEEFTPPETITPSEPNLLAETAIIDAEIESEQTEPITDQDLANISEWLNEKIDSNNKDVSVMDDFWDNLSSITEEINSEKPALQTESITDQELANISEWLNEKVEPNSSLNDIIDINLDDLSDRVEDRQLQSNGRLVSTVDSNLKLEEEQELNIKANEGISDSTSNFLEDFLNEDSKREHK